MKWMRRSHSNQLPLMRSSTNSDGQLGSDVKLFSYTTNSGGLVPVVGPPVGVIGVEPAPLGSGGVVPVPVEAGAVVPRVLVVAAGSTVAGGSDMLTSS